MTSSVPRPPVSPPRFTLSAQEISKLTETSISKTTSLFDHIASLPPSECTFQSVVLPLAEREAEVNVEVEPAVFLQSVSKDEGVRKESTEAEKKLKDFDLDCLTRKDVYDALVQVQKIAKSDELNKEEKRLLERLLLDRTRNGLALSDDKKAKLLEIKKKISSIAVDFSSNFNQEKGFLLFTADELEGLPEDVISSYPLEDGKHKVTHKTPDIVPLFKFARKSSTRKQAYLSYERRLEINTPLFAEVMKLRKQAADLLGYSTWADYILEVKMAKSAKTVNDFLADLEERLKSIGAKERSNLLEMKKEECDKRGEKFDGVFKLWDYRYYDRLWTKQTLSLDEEAVKAYFPVPYVIQATLKIYQSLLNVVFYPVAKSDSNAWHEDVQTYAAWDGTKKNGQEHGDFLGYMYLDLFPRENKYGHAAVFPLVPGWQKYDGSRNYPVVAMVANLAKPTEGKPSLMKHDDVVTFFHEMGHAFHGLLSYTQFARFHGTAVARDFVEAPSKLMENWCWTTPGLKAMSSHHERPGESLTDELISKIIESRRVNSALFNLRQLFFGKFDMAIHTTEANEDLTALYDRMREETSLVSTDGEVTAGQSAFAHLIGGYDAGYYGYQYAEVFAADMFKTVFAADPMDAKKGVEYRAQILRPGGSRDEMESLTEFLGREPNNQAFLEELLGSA